MVTVNNRFNGIGMTSQRTRGRMVARLRRQGILDETVLAAMGEVPRHIFVDEALASRAYEDLSLPLGFGQTISSPYVVARMAELARAGSRLGRVLEIGTGCGYQAAVLSRIAREVYTLERIASLVAKARRNLRELRVGNVKLKHADGRNGLLEVAPFDAIILAAATLQVPETLLSQLAVGGRMVLPRGAEEQVLCVIDRTPQGYSEMVLDEVKFVPLIPGVG